MEKTGTSLLRKSARTMRLASASLAAMAALCLAPHGAVAETTTTTANTEIVIDTRLVKLADLDFGEIIPGDTGGTITLSPAGAVSTSGSVISAGGNPQSAEFRMTRRLFIDFPTYVGPAGTDSIELAHTSLPGQTMTLRDFTTDYNRTVIFGLPGYFFLTEYDFRVAGTLDVGANQQPGTYLGTFTVTIDYN
ncbi:DUF4402 domain-containing protein [Qipengyuania sp. S6317L1]|uniref:DUF4402 domain-containing protein n=1 Tax=Qipengyuania sp. S6317L1 TaxID=2926410 RepID=UPI001FF1D0CD|nr:DUF4402 domain-containing protein [Qipengyuania sp. S6317L1]MCK0097776.1 DUF4402 domain-containing protein [Qipengyuania sp. S6317L1]